MELSVQEYSLPGLTSMLALTVNGLSVLISHVRLSGKHYQRRRSDAAIAAQDLFPARVGPLAEICGEVDALGVAGLQPCRQG